MIPNFWKKKREDLDVPQTRINATSSAATNLAATTNKDDGDKNHMSIATDDFSLYLLPQSIVIDDVNDHDVLMGPRKCKKHPGNKVYRDIVKKYRPQLEAIGDRALVANMVIDHIHYQIGGRFLKADSTNQWHVVPRLDVITKIKKALVGLRTPSIGGPALPNSISTITMLESVGQSIVEQDNKRPKRKSACREVIDDDNDEDRAELTKLQISPQSMADGLSQNDNDVPHPIVNPQRNGEDNSDKRGEATSAGHDVIDLLDDDKDEDQVELTKLQISLQSKADETAQKGIVISHPVTEIRSKTAMNDDDVERCNFPNGSITDKSKNRHDDDPSPSIIDLLNEEKGEEHEKESEDTLKPRASDHQQVGEEEEETIEDNDDIIVIGSSSAPIDIDDLLEEEERNEERFDPLKDNGDIQITGSTGKNALSDYPHPRHECVVKSFTKNPEQFCPNCYCFVCDIKASECAEWKDCHCKADSDIKWRLQRRKIRNKRKAPERARQRLAISFIDYDTDQDLSLATTSQRRTRRTRSNVSITTLLRGSSQKDVQGVHFLHNT
ncbi:hypothetical protein FRACYDRAFT_265572 [Fragilariopsis cylindrus CCMP1102]|uniref:DUF6824 domain-containing protein n=1 Tax=Fragilariopsis cylindrus CCMP1102 TaxID=635003 RepID=A0A1E7ELF0_9STRA|nr:hypothetical protein FRACYDRAFT_265572 [Fragilariopsis cylindrus CCMP1102]|eukprot:OEU06738.1 hypothetical protein FRACYDRAFT_265572 [Fragilariopsis cylindrus CCMP1102]